MMRLYHIIYIMCIFVLCSSCSGSKADDADQYADSLTLNVLYADTLLELTKAQADSLDFRLSHHYTNNFNFLVSVDSLLLLPLSGSPTDTAVVSRGDVIAVADIVIPSDSADTVWIKVARDQLTMGWIPEPELLSSTTPDDTISVIIDRLSSSRIIWMPLLMVIGATLFLARGKGRRTLPVVRYDEIDSFYPCLLLIAVSVMACLYASIQKFLPEFWQEYYYHPTLNPFILPPLMAVLVSCVWLIIILFVALTMEVYKRFFFLQGLAFMLEMCGMAMCSYLLIAYTTPIYIGYGLLLVYLILLIAIIIKSTKYSH